VVFVIEGTGDKRRIVSVGTSEALYTLAAGQEFRTAKTEPWPGWPRREMHWDEVLQTEVHEPYPLPAEELAAKLDAEAEARLLRDLQMLKAIEIIVREIEYLRPDAKPRQPAFQALIDKLQSYREA
jgi:hypothetical protein